MTRRIFGRHFHGIAILLVLASFGCATSGADGDVPAHPFPRWVAALEPGVTGLEEIEAIFGRPAESEESVRGGLRWRYAFAEIHWAADDPDRPAVAADGQPIEKEETWVDRAEVGLAKTGRFLDALLFYPPRQLRGPRTRSLDATVHVLEVRFTTEGLLDDYRYAPRRERVRVPVGGA